MKIDRFQVKINDEGGILFKSKEHASLFRRFLQQWNGQEIFLSVSEKKNTRSHLQSNYYFLYLGIIARETGEDKDTLHGYFKNKFLTTGISELYGDKVRITKSTTELTKGEFSDYIASIVQLTGIESPNTKEFWGVSYHK